MLPNPDSNASTPSSKPTPKCSPESSSEIAALNRIFSAKQREFSAAAERFEKRNFVMPEISPEESQRLRDEEAQRKERENRLAELRMQNHIMNSGVSLRHLMSLPAIKAIDKGEWFDTLQNLREAIDEGLITALIGSRGTGKTQAASLIVDEYCRARKSVKLITLSGLFREIRDCFNSKTKTEAKYVEEISRLQLLIVDESHERSGTDFEIRTLTAIIDARYGLMLPTVLISNETRAAFADSVGTSAASRMQECGRVIECKWKSFRAALPEDVKAARQDARTHLQRMEAAGKYGMTNY